MFIIVTGRQLPLPHALMVSWQVPHGYQCDFNKLTGALRRAAANQGEEVVAYALVSTTGKVRLASIAMLQPFVAMPEGALVFRVDPLSAGFRDLADQLPSRFA
jgi:hypothetical protein